VARRLTTTSTASKSTGIVRGNRRWGTAQFAD
jgi:hypothetical protein